MALICCSINHKRAPVRILETLTFKNLNEALFSLKGIAGVEECSILQTCHRIEIYLYVSEKLITDALKNFFKEKTSNNYSFDK